MKFPQIFFHHYVSLFSIYASITTVGSGKSFVTSALEYLENSVYTIESINFPQTVDRPVDQLWEIHTATDSRIKIHCPIIRLPQTGDTCDISSLTILDENGKILRTICGVQQSVTIVSSTNRLYVRLYTHSGLIQCTAIKKFKYSLPEPVTTVPPPILSSSNYWDMEEFTIDSSEHGVPPGVKNTSCPCGWANKLNGRIVGGSETRINEYPFMAALVYTGYVMPFCGASIITAYHALTAAHCLTGVMAKNEQISVVVGEHDYTKTNETKYRKEIPVKRMLPHEHYNDFSKENDIALLVLTENVRFSRFVGRVCLPDRAIDVEQSFIRILGWGKTSTSGISSRVLKKLDERVITMKQCNEVYGYVRKDYPTQICTWSKNKGACYGDSGGPVLYLDPETNRYTVVGIASFVSKNNGCASIKPTVHARVSVYMPWIVQHIEDSHPVGEACYKM